MWQINVLANWGTECVGAQVLQDLYPVIKLSSLEDKHIACRFKVYRPNLNPVVLIFKRNESSTRTTRYQGRIPARSGTGAN
jgi:hypothetical protein